MPRAGILVHLILVGQAGDLAQFSLQRVGQVSGYFILLGTIEPVYLHLQPGFAAFGRDWPAPPRCRSPINFLTPTVNTYPALPRFWLCQ